MVSGNVIMAYFTSWSIYGRNYNVWDMDVSRLSHINYAFANIENGLVVLGDPYADVEMVNTGKGDAWSDPSDMLHGNFHQLFRLKQKNRHLKVGLSIGGWTWSGQFSTVAASERSRKKFVASAMQHLLNFGFDYIDLDWEYPGGGGLEGNHESPNDPVNFVALLAEFQQQIQQHFPNEPEGSRPYVTIAAGCAPAIYQKYRLADMAKYLKYFNLMCYDFSGPWSPASEHQANLYKRTGRSTTEFSTNDGVQYFLKHGVRKDQIVVGVPFYGREFAACLGLQQPFHGTGKGSWEPGMYDYNALPMPGYELRWEKSTNATFAYNSKSKSLITFDDTRSVAFKMDYILKEGLAGTMFWEISGDRKTTDKNSLLFEIGRWLGGPLLDTTPNRLCYTKSKYRNIRDNPVCPAPAGKDRNRAQIGGTSTTSPAQHAQIMQHCISMLVGEPQMANKAHAIPRYAEQLHECYQSIVKDVIDLSK